MEIIFNNLSDIRRVKFKVVCGYEYKGGSFKNSFLTDRPYNKDWDLSPWTFSFIIQSQTGFLFCELAHRMTNNRTFGWDRKGNEIEAKLIDLIFPRHM